MSDTVKEFIHFLGIEKENELKTFLILENNFFLIHNLDILFHKSIEITLNKSEYKIPAFLYLNTHREFYLSMANFLRLHSSSSFRNLRCALDSVFTAYYLLKHPDSTDAYLSNLKSGKNKEWNKIFRNIKYTIKNDIQEFPLASSLPEMHEFCSVFSHSDALGIITRYFEDQENLILAANYCDYEKNNDDYKKWLGALLTAFFRIYLIFWEELIKKIADEKLIKEINIRIKAYTEKLNEFRLKYPFGPQI